MNYWLMKSEPHVYGIADLAQDKQTLWDGVRNYQARNFLRDMQPGDQVFFYHSNAEPPGISGLMQVVESGVIDPTQFDPDSPYFDPKSPPEQPRWQTVTVEFVQKFPNLVSLERLRQTFTPEQLLVVRQGNRLSVLPVEKAIAEKILEIASSSSIS